LTRFSCHDLSGFYDPPTHFLDGVCRVDCLEFVLNFNSHSINVVSRAGAMALIAKTMVSRWFVRRRALALAWMALGFTCGSTVIPPLNAFLIQQYGISIARVLVNFGSNIISFNFQYIECMTLPR
jgi:hypothetical protein